MKNQPNYKLMFYVLITGIALYVIGTSYKHIVNVNTLKGKQLQKNLYITRRQNRADAQVELFKRQKMKDTIMWNSGKKGKVKLILTKLKYYINN